ncbi:MAG: hypothetical protein NXI24_10630 [bacterium]|nr:hypothetical protein [bacterium]
MGGSPEYSIQLEQDDLPPHTHSASFTADVLNEHLESSRIREDCAGRVRLNSNESDGSRGPYHGYPGRPLTASPWAKPETANAQMAPDLFRDTRVAEATLTTSFGDGEHPVTLHSAGRGRSIGLNTQSPVLVVNFVITVLGEFPPRN